MRRTTPAFVLVVLLAACGRGYEAQSEPAPAASAAIDPVGVYDFTVSMGGETRSGMLTVTRTDAGYGGTATLEGEADAATVTGASAAGNVVTIVLAPPHGGGDVSFVISMTGNTFAGNVFIEGESIPVTGTKR